MLCSNVSITDKTTIMICCHWPQLEYFYRGSFLVRCWVLLPSNNKPWPDPVVIIVLVRPFTIIFCGNWTRKKSESFFQHKSFGKVICKMVAILFKEQQATISDCKILGRILIQAQLRRLYFSRGSVLWWLLHGHRRYHFHSNFLSNTWEMTNLYPSLFLCHVI